MLGGTDKVLINKIPVSWLNSANLKGILKYKHVHNSDAQIAPRRGAFEIYANIGAPQNEQLIIPIFSKIVSMQFPHFAVVRDRCNAAMAQSESGSNLKELADKYKIQLKR